ncbi:MAG: hypothetical protein ACRDA8_09390 [Shewanella sp.]
MLNQRVLKGSVIAALAFSVTTGAMASEAEKALSQELIECAAYYQISSEAIAGMNAPQMQAVGERLKNAKIEAENLAKKYQPQGAVTEAIATAKAAQLQSLGGGANLGPLMGKYKGQCQTLLADPQKRLDYWIMATM